jgi:hypothetical protein
MLSVGLWWWYINITITILDIGVGVLVADSQSTSKSGYRALPLGPLTRVYFALLSLDNYVVLLSMRPLWRENGSVIYCTIASGPCQSNHTLAEVPQNSCPYFTVSFETPPTWRARFPYLYPPGTGWPSYTPGHWVPFPSPLTTRRDYGGSILTRLHTGGGGNVPILDIIHRPVFYLKLTSPL